MSLQPPSARPIVPPLVLTPSTGWSALNLKDLWRYRELMFFLTWRDVKVRYKQTALGVAWAVLRPLIQMVVFSLIFGGIAQLDSEGYPYAIFTYAALLPWQLFSMTLNEAGRSMVSNRHMITKIYFPRLVIPFSSLLSSLVDFAVAFVILGFLMVYFKTPLTPAIWTLPLFLLLAMVASLGVSLWLAAMNVHYRDVGYALPFVIEVWKYITPVAYSAAYISERWQLLYSINPMAGVVQGFRWALLGIPLDPASIQSIWISTIVSVLVLVSGLFYFRRMERTFADVV